MPLIVLSEICEKEYLMTVLAEMESVLFLGQAKQ